MKILIVNNKFDQVGGAEVYAWSVAKGLQQRAHLVTFLAGEGAKPEETNGVEPLLVKDLALEKLQASLEGKSFDIVYLQNIYDEGVVGFFAKQYKTVHFVHDHYIYCPGTAKYWFGKKTPCDLPLSNSCYLYAFSQKCMSRNPLVAKEKLSKLPKLLDAYQKLPVTIVASDYIKDQLVLNGFQPSNIKINPLFGFVPSEVSDSESVELSEEDFVTSSQPARPVVLFVGRVFLEKGLRHLILASRMITIPHQVRVAGTGWDIQNCKDLVKKLDMEHQVKFLDWLERDQISAEIANCSLMVVPSLWPEPFGLVGIEAMSHSKPIVSYGTGGISQWLRDGENGLLAEYNNIESLAECIKRLLSDKELSARLGRRGREMAGSEFSLQRHLERLEDIFRSC